jgi:hypothetical protein
MIEELLPLPQQEIIKRAAGYVKAARRADFIKHVGDQLRSRRDPPTNSDVRFACSVSLHKYRT